VPAMPGCVAGHFIDAIDIPVFAVHDCEVAVDSETGHVEVLSYRVVQDVGRALNPRAIRGQIQGGVVQGLGYALHEEVTIGADGRTHPRPQARPQPPPHRGGLGRQSRAPTWHGWIELILDAVRLRKPHDWPSR